ncbi:MAG: 50S ribosomal protein L13 [Candidatus Nealsonbacteria bacterium CG08_land_8_20_14_0_20_43_11]|uniref:Large ribosomal subunit protein uL13 n=1 Tax=Candidatus Nealsonbacteria bacterium CG08_land_8_20_14_0_20_43_11 TaxID=1974706 RepID=A0A2M6T070_9BACT|nr:MAG: 50S ribosomal protein L13 [Candidatus Nealsonbacteria bacterium CG08_land_8_20_14_0_20_43_11]
MPAKAITIDAAGKTLGRLASEVAFLLRGKNRPDFVYYKDAGETVIIKNADKIRFSGKKLEQKKYYHHTGYLGHLKAKPLAVLLAEKPEEVLRRAVYGMLPKNKLREKMIKRLLFK